jgi:hypothetical protein
LTTSYDQLIKTENELFISRQKKLNKHSLDFTLGICTIGEQILQSSPGYMPGPFARFLEILKASQLHEATDEFAINPLMKMIVEQSRLPEMFQKGYPFYYRVQSMQLYALDDLINIATVEKDQISGLVNENLAATEEQKILYAMNNLGGSQTMRYALDKYVHSFISRISTLTDNAFYMVVAYNGIPYSRQKDDKKQIIRQLNQVNKKLSERLNSLSYTKVDGISFVSLRNSSIHELPSYNISIEYEEDSIKQFSLDLVDENKKEHNVFDFLNQFYEQSLNKCDMLIKEMLKYHTTTINREHLH